MLGDEFLDVDNVLGDVDADVDGDGGDDGNTGVSTSYKKKTFLRNQLKNLVIVSFAYTSAVNFRAACTATFTPRSSNNNSSSDIDNSNNDGSNNENGNDNNNQESDVVETESDLSALPSLATLWTYAVSITLITLVLCALFSEYIARKAANLYDQRLQRWKKNYDRRKKTKNQKSKQQSSIINKGLLKSHECEASSDDDDSMDHHHHHHQQHNQQHSPDSQAAVELAIVQALTPHTPGLNHDSVYTDSSLSSRKRKNIGCDRDAVLMASSPHANDHDDHISESTTKDSEKKPELKSSKSVTSLAGLSSSVIQKQMQEWSETVQVTRVVSDTATQMFVKLWDFLASSMAFTVSYAWKDAIYTLIITLHKQTLIRFFSVLLYSVFIVSIAMAMTAFMHYKTGMSTRALMNNLKGTRKVAHPSSSSASSSSHSAFNQTNSGGVHGLSKSGGFINSETVLARARRQTEHEQPTTMDIDAVLEQYKISSSMRRKQSLKSPTITNKNDEHNHDAGINAVGSAGMAVVSPPVNSAEEIQTLHRLMNNSELPTLTLTKAPPSSHLARSVPATQLPANSVTSSERLFSFGLRSSSYRTRMFAAEELTRRIIPFIETCLSVLAAWSVRDSVLLLIDLMVGKSQNARLGSLWVYAICVFFIGYLLSPSMALRSRYYKRSLNSLKKQQIALQYTISVRVSQEKAQLLAKEERRSLKVMRVHQTLRAAKDKRRSRLSVLRKIDSRIKKRAIAKNSSRSPSLEANTANDHAGAPSDGGINSSLKESPLNGDAGAMQDSEQRGLIGSSNSEEMEELTTATTTTMTMMMNRPDFDDRTEMELMMGSKNTSEEEINRVDTAAVLGFLGKDDVGELIMETKKSMDDAERKIIDASISKTKRFSLSARSHALDTFLHITPGHTSGPSLLYDGRPGISSSTSTSSVPNTPDLMMADIQRDPQEPDKYLIRHPPIVSTDLSSGMPPLSTPTSMMGKPIDWDNIGMKQRRISQSSIDLWKIGRDGELGSSLDVNSKFHYRRPDDPLTSKISGGIMSTRRMWRPRSASADTVTVDAMIESKNQDRFVIMERTDQFVKDCRKDIEQIRSDMSKIVVKSRLYELLIASLAFNAGLAWYDAGNRSFLLLTTDAGKKDGFGRFLGLLTFAFFMTIIAVLCTLYLDVLLLSSLRSLKLIYTLSCNGCSYLKSHLRLNDEDAKIDASDAYFMSEDELSIEIRRAQNLVEESGHLRTASAAFEWVHSVTMKVTPFSSGVGSTGSIRNSNNVNRGPTLAIVDEKDDPPKILLSPLNLTDLGGLKDDAKANEGHPSVTPMQRFDSVSQSGSTIVHSIEDRSQEKQNLDEEHQSESGELSGRVGSIRIEVDGCGVDGSGSELSEENGSSMTEEAELGLAMAANAVINQSLTDAAKEYVMSLDLLRFFGRYLTAVMSLVTALSYALSIERLFLVVFNGGNDPSDSESIGILWFLTALILCISVCVTIGLGRIDISAEDLN